MNEEAAQTEQDYERFVDEMVHRVEALMVKAGATSYEAGTQKTIKLLEWLAQSLFSVKTVADLRRMMLQLERPLPIHQLILSGFLEHLPRLVAHGARYIAANEERDLPPLHGRKPVTIQEKAEIVDFILARIKNGYNTEQAKKRAGLRYGYSRATIQRIWDDRGSMQEVDYGSVLQWAMETFSAKAEQ